MSADNLDFLKDLLDRTSEGLAVVHAGRIRYANAALARLLRFPDDENPVGLELRDLVHPRDRAALAVWLGARPERDQRQRRFIALLRHDQTAFDAEIDLSAYDGGAPGTWLIALRDISERRAAEQALRESESSKAAMLQAIPDLVISLSGDGTVLGYSAGRYYTPHFREQDIVGRRLRDLFPERVAEPALIHIRRALATGEPQFFEYWLRNEDDESVHHFEVRILKSQEFEAIAIAREALRESEQKFRNLVEGSRQGVCIHRDFKPLFANQAFADMLGFDFPDDVLALESLLTIFAPEERSHVQANLAARERGEVLSGLYKRRALRRDGTRIWVENQISVVEWEGAPAVQLTSLDITDRVTAETMKNDFISTVSHELRTPLTSINGALGLISGGMIGDVPDAAKGLIDIASRNSERLVRLVNDILDIERIESGRLEIEFRPLAIAEVLENAVTENRPYADKFGIAIQISGEVPNARINAGPDQLHQVLTNLLSNAIKHSPLHGIIDISATRKGASVVVSITDHGPGIPSEFRAKVFDKFTQADASGATHGTGLGLSICKLLIEKHGGQIGFTSRPGNTTFHFSLPEIERPAAPRLVVG